MGDLDRVHARLVECGGNSAHLINAVHVANRVHAVAQRYVLNIKLVPAGNLKLCHSASFAHDAAAAMRRSAKSSPVALAAAVMMSRLPE